VGGCLEESLIGSKRHSYLPYTHTSGYRHQKLLHVSQKQADMLQLIFLFIVSKTVWKKMEKLVQS
jgi:hypothetical protein